MRKVTLSSPQANLLSLPRVRIKVKHITFLFWFWWAFRVSIIFLFFQHDPAKGTLAGGALTLLFLYSLILEALSSKNVHAKNILRVTGVKLIFAYALWAGLSLLWSTADPITSACGYWFLMVADLGVVSLLCSIGRNTTIFDSSLKGLVTGILVLSVVVLLFKPMAGSRLGESEFLHPNTIGNYLAIGALSAFYLLSQQRKSGYRLLYASTVGLFLLIILKSLSKTSIVAFFVAVLPYLFISRMNLKWKIASCFIILGAIISCQGPLLSHLAEYRTLQGGQVMETLSGRTFLWTATWEMIKDKPILGYGFMSFRTSGPQIFSFRIVHAHNEWLHLWFSVGLVGLLLAATIYFVFLVGIIRYIRQRRTEPWIALGLAMVLYSLVKGFTEANPIGLIFPLPLILLMFIHATRRNYVHENKCDS